MEPMSMFLLAMQAAGAGIQFFEGRRAHQLAKYGRKVEHAGIEANIELARTEAAEESLESIQALRKNFGTQLAIQAARGTATNIGSAFFIGQEGFAEFNRGEASRRLNLLAREAGLRASDVISGMQLLQSETEMGRRTTGQLFDLVNTYDTYSRRDKLASQTNKAATSASQRALGRSGGYGLKTVE